jgi:hypothetical protein
MRATSILLKTSLLVICILFAGRAYSQKKFEIALGVGVPVYTNLKVR